MTKLIRPAGMTRRGLLKAGAGIAAASALGAPALAQSRSIKIGSYGGYFEDSFKAHVYPAFTAATGIEVESITQPNSTDWLVTMQNAAASGTVPADLSLYSRDTIVRASRIGDILKPLGDVNADALDDDFKFTDGTGLVGVGAMSWFSSLVVNPNVVEAPTSRADFWNGETYEGSLGLSKNYNSYFLDITAVTFFGGTDVLSTREGIEAVVAKVAELRPNVALWWSAESQMEQAMKNEDVIAGMYYHDVAGIMAADGFPIQSVFPKEGNTQDYGSWCLATLSETDAEAAEFLTISSMPEKQALMSRMIGTAPLMTQEAAGLSDDEFAAVSGTPAFTPNFEAYLDEAEFIKETWDKMLAST